MRKYVGVLTTTAVILASGAIAASAQAPGTQPTPGGPMMQQQNQDDYHHYHGGMMGGGDISAHALTGNIDTGKLAQGYRFRTAASSLAWRRFMSAGRRSIGSRSRMS